MQPQHPRSRRIDILPYLKRGDQLKIAERVKCDPTTVSSTLNGRTSQTSPLAIDILTVAKEQAMRNNPFKYKRL